MKPFSKISCLLFLLLLTFNSFAGTAAWGGDIIYVGEDSEGNLFLSDIVLTNPKIIKIEKRRRTFPVYEKNVPPAATEKARTKADNEEREMFKPEEILTNKIKDELKLDVKTDETIDQYNLGVSFFNGEGVPQDYEKAVELFQKAAESGYAKAQCNLGLCYFQGKGVSKNPLQAAHWFENAAEQGEPSAQFFLSSCFFNGDGVTKNRAIALKWAILAVDGGEERATPFRNAMTISMPENQVLEGMTLARNWKPKQWSDIRITENPRGQ